MIFESLRSRSAVRTSQTPLLGSAALRLALCALLIGCGTMQTPKTAVAPDPNELQSQWINLPGGTHCSPDAKGNPTGSSAYVDWVNKGAHIEVPYSWVWIGADSAGSPVLGGVADVSYLLQDVTTGTIFAWNNWDRYANPTSLNSDIDKSDTAPYYIPVNAGDTVRLMVACSGPYPPDNYPVSVAGMAVLQYLNK
jgi:hypothetical protein